jgi:hypothetical protein
MLRYQTVRDEGAPIYQRTRTQEQENDYTLVDRLMLPLGEGEEVSKIISLLIRAQR